MKNKSLKVVFRTDASIQIGTGHVMRCLTLADELTRQGHQCAFICREHAGHLGELITSKGYELNLLPSFQGVEYPASEHTGNAHAEWLGVTWQVDADQTLAVLDTLAVDWLVVDHYALDKRWEKQVASVVGHIMVIDDLADRNHLCSLLLDQNLGRKLSDYKHLVPIECRCLIGPQYALLRPEFYQLRERSLRRRANPQLKRIMISLGGVDRTNVTGEILRALPAISLPMDTELDIIMGASAPHLEDVKQLAAQLPYQASVSVNVDDMAERMTLADLCIGAAGSTSWERCCLGVPSIVVKQALNQDSIFKALINAEVILCLPYLIGDGSSFSELMELVKDSQKLIEMGNKSIDVCDGQGASRVLELLNEIR